MKISAAEKVVAELIAEKGVVDACITRIEMATEQNPHVVLAQHSDMLAACIARLTVASGAESPAAEPKARKPRRKRGIPLEPSL